MTQLKFRVWNGVEIIYDVTVGKFGTFYVNPGSKGDGLDPNDSASLTPFTTKYSDQTPVMQFTGLHDKNGKEIYEGDWLRSFSSNGSEILHAIHWVKGEARFIAIFKGHNLNQGRGINQKWIDELEKEVIGNIHQNSELLK